MVLPVLARDYVKCDMICHVMGERKNLDNQILKINRLFTSYAGSQTMSKASMCSPNQFVEDPLLVQFGAIFGSRMINVTPLLSTSSTRIACYV